MLGYPKVLVCEAGASGPQPRRVAEASGQSQRGFSAYVFSASAVPCASVYFKTPKLGSKKGGKKAASMWIMTRVHVTMAALLCASVYLCVASSRSLTKASLFYMCHL